MPDSQPAALVTGAARRIGAAIAETLHAADYRVVIHCRNSRAEADALSARLNARRANSAIVIAADLLIDGEPERLIHDAHKAFGQLDLLVNNASSFYPTAIGKTTRAQWNDLIGSNLEAPFFLCQAAASVMTNGAIVNLIDIHGERPLANHAVYSTAKAGLHMLTRALAKDLAPHVRVNGISPGAILWPQAEMNDAEKEKIVAGTPLARIGTPHDIADAVLFLARSEFITGRVIVVDGGRSL